MDNKLQRDKWGVIHLFGRLGLFILAGCTSLNYKHTVDSIDIPKFMGTWYVWAGRTTFFERGAYSATEKYSWNEKEKRIDVDFSFHKDSFDGKLKRMPQKAWIYNTVTNAHWKVQPFWPLEFNYLVIDIDPDYKWTAIGVPNGSYLWIMGRAPVASDKQLDLILRRAAKLGYPVQDVARVPQQP